VAGGEWEGLIVKLRRRWRSDENWRGGGVFGAGSQRGGHVGGGEGGRGGGALAWARLRGEWRKEGAGAAGGFSSASVVRGSEGKKEGALRGATAWQREKEERGPRAWQSAARGGQQRPLAVRLGRRRCRATGESGRARSTQCERG
jgi:hypothetical protein